MCAKEIGSKMKRKEPLGEDDSVPQDVLDKLQDQSLTSEDLRVRVVIYITKHIIALCTGMSKVLPIIDGGHKSSSSFSFRFNIHNSKRKP